MLGIVILNYNTWNETVNCCKSIKKYVRDIQYKIYVVDNNSSEKIMPEIEDFFINEAAIELIYSCENKGYSAGNNIGIGKALDDDCKYIMICNSDVLFVDDSVRKLMVFLSENEGAGIVGPQIYNTLDEFQPFYMLSKLTAVGKIKNMFLKTPLNVFFKSFKKNFIRTQPLVEALKVFGVSGCCFMLSSECANFLYPLDENTFLYEEEYIIGVQLEKSSFEVYIIPNTHVIHAHGASTKGMSEFAYNCLIESEQYYLKEYLKTNIVLRKILFWIRKLLYKRYGR